MYPTQFHQSGAGFLDLFKNKKKKTPESDVLLNAIKNSNFTYAIDLMRDKIVKDITSIDKNKDNVLHIFAKHVNSENKLLDVEEKFLRAIQKYFGKDVGGLLKSRNDDKKTPEDLLNSSGVKGDVLLILSGQKLPEPTVESKIAKQLSSLGKGLRSNLAVKSDDISSLRSKLSNVGTAANKELFDLKQIFMKKLEAGTSPANSKTIESVTAPSNGKAEEKDPDSEDTALLEKQIREAFNATEQHGGSKSIKGKRIIEIGQSREYDKEATELRDKVLEKIIEITDSDKEKAGNIRAYLWKINKSGIEGTNKDKWGKILEIIESKNKSYFESIQSEVDELTKTIKQHYEDKEKRKSEKKEKKEKKKDKKDKSEDATGTKAKKKATTSKAKEESSASNYSNPDSAEETEKKPKNSKKEKKTEGKAPRSKKKVKTPETSTDSL